MPPAPAARACVPTECLYCHATLVQPRTGRWRVYCSAACKMCAYRERMGKAQQTQQTQTEPVSPPTPASPPSPTVSDDDVLEGRTRRELREALVREAKMVTTVRRYVRGVECWHYAVRPSQATEVWGFSCSKGTRKIQVYLRKRPSQTRVKHTFGRAVAILDGHFPLRHLVRKAGHGASAARPEYSHLCHHADCLNPAHAVVESKNTNLSRISCADGTAPVCPHNPPCLLRGAEVRQPLPESPGGLTIQDLVVSQDDFFNSQPDE